MVLAGTAAYQPLVLVGMGIERFRVVLREQCANQRSKLDLCGERLELGGSLILRSASLSFRPTPLVASAPRSPGECQRRAARNRRPDPTPRQERNPSTTEHNTSCGAKLSLMTRPWPHFTRGGSHEPYVDRILDEEAYLVRPKTVVAYGTAEGYPWSVVMFEKQGDPEEGSGKFVEFFLGGSPGLPAPAPGGLGGSVDHAEVPKKTDIKTIAQTWSTTPALIGYVVLTSPAVRTLEVLPAGSETMALRVRKGPIGFPDFCVFFPPFNSPGEILAKDGSGALLHRRELFSGRLPMNASFGGGD